MSTSTAAHPFTRATLRFLEDLADNNEREWFAENKARYENDVLEPALDFIEGMGPRLARISAHFVAVAKRSGGSLMRVYRDTRFSRDKTPYKTNVGIQFRHELGKDIHAPGFYVHIEPRRCFIGAGIWHPESEALARIRSSVAEKPDAWRKAAYGKRFTDVYALGGESLSRPPKGFPADARYIDDLKRKDFIAIAALDDAELLGSDCCKRVAERFGRAKPLMEFLCEALELRF